MKDNPTGMELCPHCGAANVQGRGLCDACDGPLHEKPPPTTATHQMEPCAPSEIFRGTFWLRRLAWRGRFIATVGLLGVLFFASGADYWPWERTASIVFPGILMSGAMLWLVQRLISEVGHRDVERTRATLQALKINHGINFFGGVAAFVLGLATISHLLYAAPPVVFAIILAPTLPAIVFNFMQIMDINKALKSDLPLLQQQAPNRRGSGWALSAPVIYLICGAIAMLFTVAIVHLRNKIRDHAFLHAVPLLFLYYATILCSLTRWWRKGLAAKLAFTAGLLGLTDGLVFPLLFAFNVPSSFQDDNGPIRAAVEHSLLSVTELQMACQCLVMLFLFAAIYSTGRKRTDTTLSDATKPFAAPFRWSLVIAAMLILAWRIHEIPWGWHTFEARMRVLYNMPGAVFLGLAVLVLLFGIRLSALAVVLTFSAVAWSFFSSFALQRVFQSVGSRSPAMWQFWLSSAVGAVSVALLVMAALWDQPKRHEPVPPVSPLETAVANKS